MSGATMTAQGRCCCDQEPSQEVACISTQFQCGEGPSTALLQFREFSWRLFDSPGEWGVCDVSGVGFDVPIYQQSPSQCRWILNSLAPGCEELVRDEVSGFTGSATITDSRDGLNDGVYGVTMSRVSGISEMVVDCEVHGGLAWWVLRFVDGSCLFTGADFLRIGVDLSPWPPEGTPGTLDGYGRRMMGRMARYVGDSNPSAVWPMSHEDGSGNAPPADPAHQTTGTITWA